MNEKENAPLSPTVTTVLDEYLEALLTEEDVGEAAAKRLDTLLREGKVPKFEDIEVALFPLTKGAARDPYKDDPY